MTKTYTIYLTKKGEEKKDRIMRHFHITGFNVNGEARVTITDKVSDAILKETALRGFIQIRYK